MSRCIVDLDQAFDPAEVGLESTDKWRPTMQDVVGALLGRVRDWWQRQEELNALDNKEI